MPILALKASSIVAGYKKKISNHECGDPVDTFIWTVTTVINKSIGESSYVFWCSHLPARIQRSVFESPPPLSLCGERVPKGQRTLVDDHPVKPSCM